MRRIDRTGNRYGRLVVLERLTNGDGHDGGLWRCACDCGTEKSVKGMQLAAGSTTSCGCYRLEVQRRRQVARRKYGETTVNDEYSRHRKSGRSRGFGFLSRDEWTHIVFQPCAYCGQKDARSYINSALKRAQCAHMSEEERNLYTVSMNGVDRILQDQGYEISNCVSCCSRCNWMKWKLSRADFLHKVGAIYRNLTGRTELALAEVVSLNRWQKQTLSAAHSNYKGRCRRDCNCELTVDQWTTLSFSPCHYCGDFDERRTIEGRFQREASFKSEMSRLRMNGIDQVDPTAGYTLSNSVSCCCSCNMMKGSLSIQEFIGAVALIQRTTTPDRLAA